MHVHICCLTDRRIQIVSATSVGSMNFEFSRKITWDTLLPICTDIPEVIVSRL